MDTDTKNKIYGVSVVIPMFNEVSRIEHTIADLQSYLVSPYEVILVDDGSTDGTIEKIKELQKKNSDFNMKLLELKHNMGKGRAVKEGVLHAALEYVLCMDADNSVNIHNLQEAFRYTTKFDMVIGSRKIIKKSSIRGILSQIGSILNKTLLEGIYDSQCPFKLCKTKDAQKIFKKMRIHRFLYDIELLYLVQKNNLTIYQMPVVHESVSGSKFKLGKDTFISLFDLFRIHVYIFFGKYV